MSGDRSEVLCTPGRIDLAQILPSLPRRRFFWEAKWGSDIAINTEEEPVLKSRWLVAAVTRNGIDFVPEFMGRNPQMVNI